MRVALVAAGIGLWGLGVPQAWSAPADGRLVFETKCIACHQGGANLLSPGKNLKLPTLERDGYSTVDPIVTLLRKGKGQAR